MEELENKSSFLSFSIDKHVKETLLLSLHHHVLNVGMLLRSSIIKAPLLPTGFSDIFQLSESR